MYKALIFDMDGVLVNTEAMYLELGSKVAAEIGLTLPPEYFERYVGVADYEMWREMKTKHSLSETCDELLEIHARVKSEFLSGDLNRLVVPHIRELLYSLKRAHILTGLASSSKKANILHILQKTKLIDFFRVIKSGEEVARTKPAPDVYLEVANLLKCKPHECVVIEDSHNGVTAAKKAGMYVVGFRNPDSPVQDIAHADTSVESIEEISVNKLFEIK